jgi:hypothetical protein
VAAFSDQEVTWAASGGMQIVQPEATLVSATNGNIDEREMNTFDHMQEAEDDRAEIRLPFNVSDAAAAGISHFADDDGLQRAIHDFEIMLASFGHNVTTDLIGDENDEVSVDNAVEELEAMLTQFGETAVLENSLAGNDEVPENTAGENVLYFPTVAPMPSKPTSSLQAAADKDKQVTSGTIPVPSQSGGPSEPVVVQCTQASPPRVSVTLKKGPISSLQAAIAIAKDKHVVQATSTALHTRILNLLPTHRCCLKQTFLPRQRL